MTIKEFLTWWLAELRALVPASLRRYFRGNEATLSVELDGDIVRMTSPKGAQSAVYSLATLDPFSDRGAALPDLAMSAGSVQRVRLTVAPSSYLSREVTLPRAARNNLGEAIGYQIASLTPFTSDSVLYACGEGPGGSDDGPIHAWLVVIPRQPVSSALALVQEAMPGNPLRLPAPPPPGEPLKVSWRVVNSAVRRRQRNWLIWAGLAAVWVVAVALHVHQRDNTRTVLEEHLQTLRNDSAEVVTLRERLDASTARLEWIDARRRDATSKLVVLDSLTGLLDDNSWLQRLDIDGRDLTLTGISKAPSSLIQTLEESPALEGVRFDALTRDRRSDADRFNLSARLQPAETAEER